MCNIRGVMCAGHVLSQLLEENDHRDQLLLNEELPIKWKLTCGGLSGAIAQSGKLFPPSLLV